MPFLDNELLWKNYKPVAGSDQPLHFFKEYEQIYVAGLADAEKNNESFFKQVFYDTTTNSNRQLTAKACRNALFIMLYRGYPMFELPFQLLESLLAIDSQLGNWRQGYLNMVNE